MYQVELCSNEHHNRDDVHFIVLSQDTDNEVHFHINRHEIVIGPWTTDAVERKSEEAVQVYRRIHHEVM